MPDDFYSTNHDLLPDGPVFNSAMAAEMFTRCKRLMSVPIAVGIVCSPRMMAQIQNLPKPEVDFFGAPVGPWGIAILQDPRITHEKFEVHYDREAWAARCKEQNEFDQSLKLNESTESNHQPAAEGK